MLEGAVKHGEAVALVVGMPPHPSWLDPRAADFNMRREPWQQEVAEARAEADRAALELRALATYDQ